MCEWTGTIEIFFFNDTATTEIYTLSLHDALPILQLSPTGDLSEAARHLFGSLRKLDAMPITYIIAELVPNHGLGLAINDRLQRAAGWM